MNTLLLAAMVLASPAPKLNYVVKSESRSWQPVEPAVIDQQLESAVGPALSELQLFALNRSTFSELKNGDYTLLVEGRFIEESEQFSVYLTFGPGTANELPSLLVSLTAEIGKRSAQDMQKVIAKLSTEAATKLKNALAQARAQSSDGVVGLPDLEVETFSWSAVTVSKPKDASGDVETLCNVRNADHLRANAAQALSLRAVDQPSAARALEFCVLRDPVASVRQRCADGLAPLARNHIPTQRILLKAMRQEVDNNALAAMVNIGKGFVGLSRKEALATWLDLIAQERTPAQGASKAADLLHDEGLVPGLEVAVARCLLQDALAYGKKTACAGLFRLLPDARKIAVAAPYLQRVKAYSQGESMVAEDIIEHLARAKVKSPETERLFIELIERKSAGRARTRALTNLANVAQPSAPLVERLVKLLSDINIAHDVLYPLGELSRKKPELQSLVLERVKAAMASMTGIPERYRGNPRERAAELVHQLERYRANTK